MGNRAIYANFEGKITKLDEVFGEGKQTFDDGDKFALYKALAFIDYCSAKEPKHCSAATRKKLEAARLKAQRLCEEAMLEDLLERMRFADTYIPPHIKRLPDTATLEEKSRNIKLANEYRDTCGTEVFWRMYRRFVDRLGGQHIDFRSYVQAATRASLKKVWSEDTGDVLMATKGSDEQKIGNLITYAQRLGFVVDAANDTDGSLAIVLVDVKEVDGKKLVARSGKKVKRLY